MPKSLTISVDTLKGIPIGVTAETLRAQHRTTNVPPEPQPPTEGDTHEDEQ